MMEKRTKAWQTLFISSFFLVTSLYTVKISILLFYYHLFSVRQWFRKAVLIMCIILSMWWLSSFLVRLSTANQTLQF
jgi:hypothetical protein